MKHSFSINWFILAGLLFCNFCFAQMPVDEVLRQSILVSTKLHDATKSETFVLKGEEANKFDIEKYLNENLSKADVRILGTKTSYEKTVKIDFDSKKMNTEVDCYKICKKIVKVEKTPVFGLTVSPVDDLSGVLVETVFAGSAAEQAGIQQGDLITYVGEDFIQSGCDMLVTVGNATVGEVLDVQFETTNERKISPIALGYKLKETVSYEYCCPQVLAEKEEEIKNNLPTGQAGNAFTVFPNPTEGLTQLKFQATEKSNLTIHLTDVAGHILKELEVQNFDGYLNETLDLSVYSAGLYFIQITQGKAVFTEKVVLQKR